MIEIPLYRHKRVVGHAIVDDDQSHLLTYRWSIGTKGHVRRSWREMTPDGPKTRNEELHRRVMGFPPGVVDHKDGNVLDCRRANLRVVTHRANQPNRGALTGRGSSQYRGVVWNARRGKWQAQVCLDYHLHYLGLYEDEAEAARVVAEWRSQHMPDSLREVAV